MARKIKYRKDDIEWAKKIKERDGWTCQRCDKPYPEKSQGLYAAHIFSRRYKKTRHDLENGVSLCFGCHMWVHGNPLDGNQFFRNHLGEERYIALSTRAKKIMK